MADNYVIFLEVLFPIFLAMHSPKEGSHLLYSKPSTRVWWANTYIFSSSDEGGDGVGVGVGEDGVYSISDGMKCDIEGLKKMKSSLYDK